MSRLPRLIHSLVQRELLEKFGFAVGAVLAVLIAVPLGIGLGVLLDPGDHYKGAIGFFAAWGMSIGLGLYVFPNIYKRYAQRLILMTGNGQGLLPDQKTLDAYNAYLPAFKPKLDPRASIKLGNLLTSDDRDAALDGVRIAKECGEWEQRAPWLVRHALHSANEACVEEALKSGVLLAHYNAHFEPATMTIALTLAGQLHRQVLCLLLERGIDINDVDVDGATILDRLVERRATHHYGLDGIDSDVAFLLELGVRSNVKTADPLRKIRFYGGDAPESLTRAMTLLDVRAKHELLTEVAVDHRPKESAEDEPVRRAM